MVKEDLKRIGKCIAKIEWKGNGVEPKIDIVTNGSCINGCQPRSSSQASTPVPMADNPAPHLDTEKSPDSPPNHDVNVLNELEVPSTFCFFGSQYLKFDFFFLEDLADSSANVAPYFNWNYLPVLENGPLESTDTGFSGAS